MKEKKKANNIAANNNNMGDQPTESNHVVGPTIQPLITENNSFLGKVTKSKLRISQRDIPSNILVSSRDSFINSSASSRNSCLTFRLNGELSSLFDESLDEYDDFQEVLIE